MIRRKGGIILNIKRDSVKTNILHESETDIIDDETIIINNNGTLNELYDEIDEFMFDFILKNEFIFL